MVNAIGYNQRNYHEKQDIKREELGGHRKSRGRNVQ